MVVKICCRFTLGIFSPTPPKINTEIYTNHHPEHISRLHTTPESSGIRNNLKSTSVRFSKNLKPSFVKGRDAYFYIGQINDFPLTCGFLLPPHEFTACYNAEFDN